MKHGAAERRHAHRFFDPHAYLASLTQEEAAACADVGPFRHFLAQDWGASPEPQVSPGFDPVWYKASYPDVAEAIPATWHSALHHFLAHGQHAGFSPLPPAPRIKIHVDQPRHRAGEALAPVTGPLDVIGWAASNQPIASVDVYIDGDHCGRAHHGMRTEGVAATFPELTYAMFAGFRFVGPAPPAPGRHVLRIVARGEGGLQECETVQVTFGAAEEPAESPWSLRRRMRASEAEFKLGLLRNAGLAPEFCIVLRDTAPADGAAGRTLASLERQVYRGWRLYDPAEFGAAPAADLWLVPLSAGDEPGVDALLELALHQIAEPAADFIYSDERRIDPASGAMAPFFKPDWSPELLLSQNYVGRLWAASADLVARAGVSEAWLAEANPFDAVLRLTERAAHVAHVPLVLCESAAQGSAAPAADRTALEQALARSGDAGAVEPGILPHLWRIRHFAPAPLVSVIIPTAGAIDAFGEPFVAAALHMVRACTDYPRLEVIVIDTAPDTQAPWRAAVRAAADVVIEDGAAFNWSRLNNRAAAVASGEALLFLNDDVAGTDSSWLAAMVEQVSRPGVGAVGPRLLYPGGMVQHAGIFLGRAGGRHAFHGCAPDAPGPFGLAQATRNVSAVTGACLLTRRDVFARLGGFDERLDIACNDVDFCLRCLDAGLRVIYTPHATLIHHESATRAGLSAAEAGNEALFGQIWRARMTEGDPYFSRHLSLAHSDYRPEREFCDIIHPGRPLAAAASIRRLLVVKLDHIGDFVVALPAIRRLKQHFADARLTLLAAPAVCAVAALEPAIDETSAFEFFHARSVLGMREISPSAVEELSQALRGRRFDLAIDLRCHEETRVVLQTCGATWLAGFDQAFAFPWLDIVAAPEPDNPRGAKRMHMADTLLDFANRIAAAFSPGPVVPALAVEPGFPSACLDPGHDRPRIAIHAGTGNPMRQWPAGHFVSLIDRLHARSGCSVVLVGGSDDQALAAEITAAVSEPSCVASAAGLTSLHDLAGLLACCDLFIGNNSGPHHLAAELGIPTIGIHSGVVDAREWGPSGPASVALRRRMVCSPCYIARPDECPRALECLTGLGPETVIAAAARMLAVRRTPTM